MIKYSSSCSEVSSPYDEYVLNSPIKKKSIHKKEKEGKKYYDQFKNSIHSFIYDIEIFDLTVVNITTLCMRYKFQKRRFYDVLNVLEAIGCCHKLKSDSIQWFGLSNVPPYLLSLQKKLKVNLIETKLEDIFRADESIIISQLTQLFIMCFLVIQNQTLNIKHIACFLSRHNQRYKTTLCKLYQITHILEAAGILRHTSKPCVIFLDTKYYNIISEKESDVKSNDPNPYSIENLLNDHISEQFQKVVKKRKFEFYTHVQQLQATDNALYQ